MYGFRGNPVAFQNGQARRLVVRGHSVHRRFVRASYPSRTNDHYILLRWFSYFFSIKLYLFPPVSWFLAFVRWPVVGWRRSYSGRYRRNGSAPRLKVSPEPEALSWTTSENSAPAIWTFTGCRKLAIASSSSGCWVREYAVAFTRPSTRNPVRLHWYPLYLIQYYWYYELRYLKGLYVLHCRGNAENSCEPSVLKVYCSSYYRRYTFDRIKLIFRMPVTFL